MEVFGNMVSDGSINGDVICHGSIDCHEINGDVRARGDVRACSVSSYGEVVCRELQK